MINQMVSHILSESLGPSNAFDNAYSDGVMNGSSSEDYNDKPIVKDSKDVNKFLKRLKNSQHRDNCDDDEIQLDKNRVFINPGSDVD